MRSRRITAIALSTLVATAGLTAVQTGAAHAQEPGTDGLLAADTAFGPVVANPDGKGSNSPSALGYATSVAWSSDGSRIATSQQGQIVVSNPDGTLKSKYPAMGTHPTWYASNTELVYAGNTNDLPWRTQLYVLPMALAGQPATPTLLLGADSGTNDDFPKAHGNLVAFTRQAQESYYPNAAAQVWIFDGSAGGAHKVLDNASQADISPDGTKLVFARHVGTGGTSAIFEANLDGSGAVQLTSPSSGEIDMDPAWSPSGTRVAFAKVGTGGVADAIQILDVAAGTQTTWPVAADRSPAWQPVNASAPKPPPALNPALTVSVGDTDSTGTEPVTLDASHTVGTGALTYTFDFGDGSKPTTSSNPVMTVREKEGSYNVSVTVTDPTGQVAVTAPRVVTIGDAYNPVQPRRILDTRSGLGAPQGKTRSVTLTLPDSFLQGPGPIRAVVLNVTVTDTDSSGNVLVYPHGLSPVPLTSNLNFTPGVTVANLVTVPVTDGKVVLTVNGGPVSLVADLAGYYTAGPPPDPGLGGARRAVQRDRDPAGGPGPRHRVPRRAVRGTDGVQRELQHRADHPQRGAGPDDRRHRGLLQLRGQDASDRGLLRLLRQPDDVAVTG